MDGPMLNQSAIGDAQPPLTTAVEGSIVDNSMQVLEYLVASVAILAAVVLAFFR